MNAKDLSQYNPNPVTITENELDTSLRVILDKLARNVHEQWAAGRIAQHWVAGPLRDDIKREHPSLVPYDALSESEKEYDKQTVLATIGFLLESGFEILPKVK